MGAQSTLNSQLIGERINVTLWLKLSGLTVQEATAVDDERYPVMRRDL